MTATAYNETDA